MNYKKMNKQSIKFLIMDVDGTLTDGKIYMATTGELFKVFDIKDGCGIHDMLPKHSITPVIITARESQIVLNRAEELGISHVYQQCRDKVGKLREVCNDELNTVAYIGDDILDLQCMEPVKAAGGLVGCPGDAVEEVKKISDYICKRNGGDGAVREFIEWVVSKPNR